MKEDNSVEKVQESELGCEPRTGLCSAEVLVMLNAIKKAKEEEDGRFDVRMKDAVEELERKSRFRSRVYVGAASIVVGTSMGYDPIDRRAVRCRFRLQNP